MTENRRKQGPIAWRVMFIMALGLVFMAHSLESRADESTVQPENGRAKLQRMYSDYLKAEGYVPEVDSDGDVRFKREGKVYFISVQEIEDDPEFFRVVLANIWEIENDQDKMKVLAAADHSNSNSKVCKIYTVENYVWASVELYVGKPEDFKNVFKRVMSAFDTGVVAFAAKMLE